MFARSERDRANAINVEYPVMEIFVVLSPCDVNEMRSKDVSALYGASAA